MLALITYYIQLCNGYGCSRWPGTFTDLSLCLGVADNLVRLYNASAWCISI